MAGSHTRGYYFFPFLSHLLTVGLSPPKIGPVVSRPVVLLPHAEKTRAARIRLLLTEVVGNTTETFLPLPLAHLYYWIELAVLEKTLLAFVPMSLMVPTTSTRITASITAYSAMSWPASSDHKLQRRLVKVRLPSHSETTRVYTFPSGSERLPRSNATGWSTLVSRENVTQPLTSIARSLSWPPPHQQSWD